MGSGSSNSTPAYQTTYQSSYGGSRPATQANQASQRPVTSSFDYPPQTLSPPPVSFQQGDRSASNVSHSSLYGEGRTGQYAYPPQSAPVSTASADVWRREDDEFEEDLVQDTSKDITLSRIMAAEEYLQNMDDTDKRIENLAEINDREAVYDNMTEALGLRGHLQDELLRIMDMLKVGDEHLKCLRPFANYYPAVVKCLRDLSDKANALEAVSASRISGQQTNTVPNIRPELLRSIEEHVEEVDTVAAQTEHLPITDKGDGTSESHLKAKHQVEEQCVSERFADRVLSRSIEDPTAIHRLLHDHAMSMQALRDRQRTERERISSTLQQHRKDLYTNPNASSSSSSTSQSRNKNGRNKPVGKATLITHQPLPPIHIPAQGDNKANNEQFDSDDDLDVLVAAASQSANRQAYANGEEDEFDAEFGDDLKPGKEDSKDKHSKPQSDDSEDEGSDLRRTFTKDMWEKHKKMTQEDFKAMIEQFKETEEKKNLSNLSDGNTQTSQVETAEQMLNTEDDEFIRRVKASGASGENIDQLLQRHLSQTEAIRRQKLMEKARLDEKLRGKLDENKRNKLLELDEDTENELQVMDDELIGIVMSQQNLSAEDVDKLLREHRKRQAEILNMRSAQSSKFNDKLKQKIAEGKRKDMEKEDSSVAQTPDDLFKHLQTLHQNGELSQPLFQEKLKQFLSKDDLKLLQDRREQRRKLDHEKEQDDEMAQQTASTLVSDHKQKAKQIRVSREREKQAFDQKLQAALKKKKREREAADGSDYDF